MAGIGFTLKKLADKDDLLGVARAYTHAALAAAGPWLFTIIALAGITLLYNDLFGYRTLENFRVVIVYNLASSLVLSAPVFMVVTRYLADGVHTKDVTNTPSVMLGSLVLLYAIQIIPSAVFYLGYVEFPLSMRLSAMANLFLITTVWLLGVFLMALKDYNSVSRSYGVGMVVAIIMAQLFKGPFADVGMVNGFSIGLLVIVYTLTAKIFAEYPYKLDRPFGMMRYFRKYWELALGGLFYNMALWVDKLIMWFAPERVKLPSKMIMYPDYDTAMFLAYITIVPSMAMFIFSIETHFFTRYQRFYEKVLEHAPLSKIRELHQAIIDSILENARNFLVIQGTITFLAVVLAAQIFELLNINYLQIGIFRLGTLGGFFHVLVLFEMIILSYFDHRKVVMWTQAFFLASNAVFTIISMNMGFPFYGYGYFLSALLTFFITSMVLFTHIRKLPYHAFITTNNSVLKPNL